MKNLILNDLVNNSSSVEEGIVLFNKLKKAYLDKTIVLLEVDSNLSLSSSFLNASVGAFLDDYGLDNFKRTVKFKGSKTQFHRLSRYIESYKELYLG